MKEKDLRVGEVIDIKAGNTEIAITPLYLFRLAKDYGLLNHQAEKTWEARQPEVDEAGKVVATDIGQMLCVLAGNLMLEDKEAGSLLASQLQPIMDWLKAKYIPDLPRLATVETIINQQVHEAEQRGIRRVVEWLEEHREDKDALEKWQEFLKECGL